MKLPRLIRSPFQARPGPHSRRGKGAAIGWQGGANHLACCHRSRSRTMDWNESAIAASPPGRAGVHSMPNDHPGLSATPSTSEFGSGSRAGTRTQPMQHGHRPAVSEQIPASLVPETGWHFLHLFYRVDRARLAKLSPEDRQRGLEDFRRASAASPPGHPEQIQCFAVPGHKADFGIVMAGPDLRAIHDIQMAVQASSLGPVLDADLFVLLDHRDLRVRSRRRRIRSHPSRTRSTSIPRAACSRPRWPPTPSGWGR